MSLSSSSPCRSSRELFISSHKGAAGFTLIELLVVIGIIAIMIGILLPTLSRARQSSWDVRCQSNLSQMGLALKMYAHDNKDHWPSVAAAGGGLALDPLLNPVAPAFRRGINEPDPVDPTKVETQGLHNLLFRLGYLKNAEVWTCLGVNGWSTQYTTQQSYQWNVRYTFATMTSLQRNRAVVGTPSPTAYWFIQDNYNQRPFNTNAIPGFLTTSTTNFQNIPHPFRMNPRNAGFSQGRWGATNVLFIDGSVGRFLWVGTSGTPKEVIRGG